MEVAHGSSLLQRIEIAVYKPFLVLLHDGGWILDRRVKNFFARFITAIIPVLREKSSFFFR